MKRDMDIIRKVLLHIEENYEDTALYNIEIDNLDMKTIAYHCKILHDAGYISDYKGQFYDDEIGEFGVGSLTWEGHEFLDKIRDEKIWKKTKSTIREKGLPMAIDVVKDVASAIIISMTQATIKGIS